jgi:hypothetical protein
VTLHGQHQQAAEQSEQHISWYGAATITSKTWTENIDQYEEFLDDEIGGMQQMHTHRGRHQKAPTACMLLHNPLSASSQSFSSSVVNFVKDGANINLMTR